MSLQIVRDELRQTSDGGYELILYLSSAHTEFARELGDNGNQGSLEDNVRDYVNRKYPGVKASVARVVASGIMLASIPLAMGGTVAAAAPNDMNAVSDWAQPAVQHLVDQKIIVGDENGNFNPLGPMNRDTFTAMIVRTLGLTLVTPDTPTFTDVQKGDWAYPYVETAVAHGLISGEGQGIFAPTDHITREQMATIFVRALGLTPADIKGMGNNLNFVDANQISPYAQDAVGFAVANGLLKGVDPTHFAGAATATRQEVAVLADRFLTNQTALQAAVKTLQNAHAYASVSVTGNNNVAIGGQEQLSVIAQDAQGNPVALPTGSTVTWNLVSPATGAVINQSGNFIASAAGTYTVTATVNGVTTAPANVVVYGQAAGVKLSAAAASVVANGVYNDVVTATVVDSNGNAVNNFNGTATLNGVTNGNAVDSLGRTLTTVTFTNGVATFNVNAPSSKAGDSDTITLSNLVSTNAQPVASSVSYSPVTINYTAATASAIGLTPVSNTISANTGGVSQNVKVFINDSTGNPLASGNPVYVTFTVTGPGSFQAGSTTTTLSEYVTPSLSGTLIPIYNIQGQTGQITITATAPGFTNGTATMTSVVTGAPTAFTVNSVAGTVYQTGNTQAPSLAVGTPFTLYSAQLTDSNGNSVAPTTNDALTVTDNTATTGGNLVYYAINPANGQPTGAALTAATLGGALTSANNGFYQFAVVNTAVATTNPTITIADALTGTNKQVTYAYNVGSAAWALFPGETTGTPTAAAQNVTAGQTFTQTVQLNDANGNSLSKAGQTVNFYFTANAAAATINGSSIWSATNPITATTDSTGKATVTITIPSGATGGYTLASTIPNSGNVAQSTVTVSNAAVVASAIGLVDATTAPAAASTPTQISWPTTSMTSGTTLATYVGATNSLFASALNAVGQVANTTDQIQITSSNTSVLSIAGATNGVITQSAATALPAITAGQTGTATLTIQDISNPNAPAITKTITVAAGTATQLAVTNPSGAMNTAYTFASTGVSGPFTVNVTDPGGDIVPVSSPLTISADQIKQAIGYGAGNAAIGVRTSASGSDTTSVTIPQNQSSIQVWLDGVTANTATVPPGTPVALSSIASQLTSSSVVGTTLTLTFTDPLTTNASASTLATYFTVSGNTVTSAVVSGNTVTLTLGTTTTKATPAMTVSYTAAGPTGTLATGYGAQVAAISSAAVTNSNTQ